MTSNWKPISEAPKDGTKQIVGSKSAGEEYCVFPYTFKAKFIDGSWQSSIRLNEYYPVEPQPTYFLDLGIADA